MLIGGRYEVVGVLGEGGMGVVYEARQRDLDRRVAVKVLRGEAARDPEMVGRFRREARVAASLTSPHVARILDFGTTQDGSAFMVLELLQGRDLQAEIDGRGRLPLDEAIGIVLDACEGIREAHARGITHRDLKPGNVFLAEQGGRRVVKILDFGISKVSEPEQERVTVTKGSFGTPLYMSPEQIKSARSVDHRTDVWALGVILYEAITGVPPFEGESAAALAVAIATDPLVPASQRLPGLSPLVDACLARALTKDPARRTPSVDALAEELRRLRVGDEETVPIHPPASALTSMALAETGRATTRRLPRRSPWRPVVLAAAAVALLIAGVTLWSARSPPPEVGAAPSVTTASETSSPAPAPASGDDAAVRRTPVVVPMPSGAASADAAAPSVAATPPSATTASPRPSHRSVPTGSGGRQPPAPSAAPNVDARGRPTFL